MAPRREPLEPGSKYEKIRDLGQGGFGFVQLCRDRDTDEEVAIKFMERGEKIGKHVEREIINHLSLGEHFHVIGFREVFLTSHHLGIVMEYAAGGDLYEYVKTKRMGPCVGLREEDARWFFQQLIVGLDHCHRTGVASRDIKLENTLLNTNPRPLLKICDFGYSKSEQYHSAPRSRVGTMAYLAPEVFADVPTYDAKAVDLWSCGVMLFVMLVGKYPFGAAPNKDDKQQYQRMIMQIRSASYVIPSHVQISNECRDMLSRLLVPDPTKRISIKEIYQHPWYVTNLPRGVVEMNDGHVHEPVSPQLIQTIKALCEEARRPGPSELETDGYIDHVMGDEDYEVDEH